MMIAAVVFWVVCSTVCAVAAASKGRMVPAWIFRGLLFGPFAVVAALVDPSVDRAEVGAVLIALN